MFAFSIIVLIIKAVIVGAFLMIFWNVSMPAMFGFSRITVRQATVIVFTFEWLRYDAFTIADPVYSILEVAMFQFSKNETLSKIVATTSFLIYTSASILITVLVTRYTWNSILPYLLNAKLIHINSGQALGFACLFNWMFGDWERSTSNDIDDDDEDEDETAD